MQEAGWIDDKNIRLDYRFGGGDIAKINAAAAELVALAPELIMRQGYPQCRPCVKGHPRFRSFSH